MKFKSILFFLISAVSLTSYAQLTLNEERLLQIMSPYAIQRGLKGINISKTDEYPDNFGSMEVRNQYLEIEIGAEVRQAHPGLSEDAYAYILCHELGHFFAGAPSSRGYSTEGQCDYFASAVCLKKLFKEFPSQSDVIPHPYVKTNCDAQFTDSIDRSICYRSAMAGIEFMTEMHNWISKISPSETKGFYALPDFNQKETMFSDGYPTLQCRTETIAAGAFCNTSELRWSQRISDWACETPVAERPSCWLKK